MFAARFTEFIIGGKVRQGMRPIVLRLACAFLLFGCVSAPAVAAAPCGGDFAAWLDTFEQEAATQGVPQQAIQSALAGVTYDPTIISRDHAQGVFRQSFEQFSGRMVPPRLARAKRLLTQYSAIFSRIEQQFGVPGPVIVAIWGLETDFGADVGKFPTIRALATLAYDCRRPDKFRGELLAALRIVERGDMAPNEMRGAWAGEIGQTQFLPSSYLNTPSTTTATAAATSFTACLTRWLRPPIISKAMVGSAASRGAKVRLISRYCCSGTRRRFTRAPSPISPSSLRPASKSSPPS